MITTLCILASGCVAVCACVAWLNRRDRKAAWKDEPLTLPKPKRARKRKVRR